MRILIDLPVNLKNAEAYALPVGVKPHTESVE
jgi:hypothetical protein